MTTFDELVNRELEKARRKHAPIASTMEGWAVIAEEIDEFWEIVKRQRELQNRVDTMAELVQIAAMCRRAAEDCGLQTAEQFAETAARSYAAYKRDRPRPFNSLHEAYTGLRISQAKALAATAEACGTHIAGALVALYVGCRCTAEDMLLLPAEAPAA